MRQEVNSLILEAAMLSMKWQNF